MIYETSTPFRGDTRQAMRIAADTLSANNFRIESTTETSIRFSGPGLNSNRDNPLRGISEGEISVHTGAVHFRGNLGALRKFRLFLILFIFGLGLTLGIVFTIVFRNKPGAEHVGYLAALPLAPWIVLIPLITRRMRIKAQQAVDTLLNNMAQMAG